MKLPLNRIIAFFGPVIALVSGAVASWLVAKANILAIPGLGLNGDELATQIAGALTFALTSALLWLGQSKWLKGVHIELVNDGMVQAAAITSTAEPVAGGPQVPAELAEAEYAAAEGLPDDAEEFSSPPPGLPPVQPSQDPGIETP